MTEPIDHITRPARRLSGIAAAVVVTVALGACSAPANDDPWPSADSDRRADSDRPAATGDIGDIGEPVVTALDDLVAIALDDLAEPILPPTSVPAPPPEPPALSPMEYQGQLSASADVVYAALGEIAAAPTIDALRTAVAGAAGATTAAAGHLDGLVPPAHVAPVHDAVVNALSRFATALAALEGEVQGQQLCAGASTLARMGNLAEYEELRVALAGLTAADPVQAFGWGETLPPPAPMPERALANGQILHDQRAPGDGWLEIDNGTVSDAVITLVQGQDRVVSIYAAAASQTTVEGIGDGVYDLYWTSGLDWDEQLAGFTRDCTFNRFDQQFDFVTTATEVTGWSITLQPVVGGTAATSLVDPALFPR